MSRIYETIPYKGFAIDKEKSNAGDWVYRIKSDVIITNMFLSSVEVSKKVIDNYLKSINREVMISTDNNKVEQFVKMLKEHDWYYDKSDDHRWWEQGNEHHKKIIKLREEINLSHNGLGNVLYKEANPFEK